MKGTKKKPVVRAKHAGPSDAAVDAVFSAYPKPLKPRLLALRRLILDTAKKTEGVGALEETLKWGQPSYLTASTKSGGTIRIDRVKASADQYALFPLPDRSGRDLPGAVSETADLRRQQSHHPERG
jgi:hypothetical protein